MKAITVGLLGALGAWFVLFSPCLCERVSFWPAMVVIVTALAAYGLWQNARDIRRALHFRPLWLVVGPVSAVALYLIFLLGHAGATALSSVAGPQVARVYALKAGTSPVVVAVLLLWIGPCEEVFWRGFIQSRLAGRFGEGKAWFIGGLLYAAVHLWSANVMLVAAALVCGLFWGGLLLKCRSLWPGILSHALWGGGVLVLFPIG